MLVCVTYYKVWDKTNDKDVYVESTGSELVFRLAKAELLIFISSVSKEPAEERLEVRRHGMSEAPSLYWQLFLELFESLPRQGPGTRTCVSRALALCRHLPLSPAVLDLGCGVGGQTRHPFWRRPVRSTGTASGKETI